MTSREQFEAWHREKYKTKYSSGQPTRDMHNGKYAHCYTVAVEQEQWEAWQASREALVVELPEEMKAREALDKGFMCDYEAGVTDTVVQMRENLIAAGIKVKGE